MFSAIAICVEDHSSPLTNLLIFFENSSHLSKAIKSLTLRGGSITGLSISILPNLTSLTLDSVSFTSLDVFFALLLSITRLQELSLEAVRWDTQTPDIPDAILRAPPLALRALSIKCLSQDEFYTCLGLRGYADVRELENLAYTEHVERHAETNGLRVAALIGNCARLRDLSLSFKEANYQHCKAARTFLSAINLAANADLRALTLVIDSSDQLMAYLDAVACLSERLRALPQPGNLVLICQAYTETGCRLPNGAHRPILQIYFPQLIRTSQCDIWW